MNCLWLTLADPDPPTNGQLIYSKGLIEAAVQAGGRLTIVGLARPESPLRGAHRQLDWHLAPYIPRHRWQNLLSPHPVIAVRGCTPEMAHTIEVLLATRRFDAVVFDSISAAWALPIVKQHRRGQPQPPKLVYLSHNHEITVARTIVEATTGLRRVVKQLDALKVLRLERDLIANADLVTSNTPEDCRRFAAEPRVPTVAFLPPGYGGPRVAARTIDAGVPRRAIIVGSFDWPPKRISLEAFLQTAVPVLGSAEVELQIVGAVEEGYLEALRVRYPQVDFVGPVDDVRPYMARARLALVPDTLGGFKLKGLDYVFNRLPILAMRVALPGMPLQEGTSISLFDSHEALAQGVVGLIDDFAELNGRHERAFAACQARFDWPRIGRHLLRHMRLARRPAAAPALQPVVPAGAN